MWERNLKLGVFRENIILFCAQYKNIRVSKYISIIMPKKFCPLIYQVFFRGGWGWGGGRVTVSDFLEDQQPSHSVNNMYIILVKTKLWHYFVWFLLIVPEQGHRSTQNLDETFERDNNVLVILLKLVGIVLHGRTSVADREKCSLNLAYRFHYQHGGYHFLKRLKRKHLIVDRMLCEVS